MGHNGRRDLRVFMGLAGLGLVGAAWSAETMLPAGAAARICLAHFLAGQVREAAAVCRPLAEKENDPAAHFVMGTLYEGGAAVPRSYEKALHHYTLAAEAGRPEAQYNLGLLYQRGLGVTPDAEVAQIWYRRSAEQGFAPAMHNLASLLSPAAAREWYRRAALAGYTPAMNNLAQLLSRRTPPHGDPTAADLAEATSWWRRGAEKGDTESAFWYGVALLDGRGVTSDPTGALHWLNKAAERGSSDAHLILGRIYRAGYGTVAKDGQKSLEHLRKAAEMGSTVAMYDLGLQLLADDKQDEALSWLQRAGAGGFPPARVLIEKLRGSRTKP
ncbi:MAG: sel1 repeat family protein [Magnetococcales bacterium]|nr:sel1 repeat family protein [Magnetococcales bacterium]